MRVLLLEPDRILASNYIKALKSAGHDADWRATAQDAIHAIEENTPDVILLEVQMPSHNGIEFMYELRSYQEWQNIPVIVLSMVPKQALGGIEYAFETLGIVDYLYKPATKLQRLLKSVDRILQPAA